MKILIRVLLVLVLLALLAVGAGVYYANSIAEAAVERGGTAVLGVDTELGSADVGLFSGEFGLSGLEVANPEGFEKEHFLTLDRASLAVSLPTLMGSRVEARELVIDGFHLALERRGGKTNYGAILDHLERFGGKGEPAPEESGEEKVFYIERVVVRNVSAYVDLLPIGGEATKASVELPELRLEGVGTDGESLRELMSRLVTAVMQATVRSLDGVVPAELLDDLKGRVAGLQDVAYELRAEAEAKVEGAVQEIQEGVDRTVGEVEGQVQETVDEAVGEAEKAAGEAVDEAKKALGGILDKAKKKDGGS